MLSRLRGDPWAHLSSAYHTLRGRALPQPGTPRNQPMHATCMDGLAQALTAVPTPHHSASMYMASIDGVENATVCVLTCTCFGTCVQRNSTALMKAATARSIPTMEALLDADAEIDHQNKVCVCCQPHIFALHGLSSRLPSL